MLEVGNSLACNGCHACYAICPVSAITMKGDSEGFLRPVIDYDLCTLCGMCERVCPILHPKAIKNNPKAYGAINLDEEIRKKSSSGGMFTLFAEEVLKEDGGVFGSKFNEEFNVIHAYADSYSDLDAFRGSKYVQSTIGNTFKECKQLLMAGKKVLFTGTPCQIGGLKSYLIKDYENLVTIDNICHGVPSPKAWTKYKENRKNKAKSAIQDISFRKKEKNKSQYYIFFNFKNNAQYKVVSTNDLFMKAFLTDTILRPSCHECVFKSIHRTSDITLADFWGIQHIAPSMDDDKGVSLLFANTPKGAALLENLHSKIKCIQVDLQDSIKYNSAAIKSVLPPQNRSIFFDKLDTVPFETLVKKYCLPPFHIKVVNKTKRVTIGVAKKLLGNKGIQIAKKVLGK